MLRTFIIREKTNLSALSGRVLDARFTGPKAEAAIETLRRLNPQADLDKLEPGTVLFVPDLPGFKAAATDSIPAEVIKDFRQLVDAGISEAQVALKTGLGSRADERAETIAAIKAARRIAINNPEVGKQLDFAEETLAREGQLDKREIEAFETTSKAIVEAMAQLDKLL